MDQVLQGLTFTYSYIDDLFVVSVDFKEDKIHVRMVLEHLQDLEILINPPKWELGVPQLQLLRHQLHSQGIHPLPDKVQTVNVFT